MKKLFSLLLAAAMLLTVSTAALAKGTVIAPAANDWNTVTLNRGSDPAAKLSFKADSDPEKFYIGLSTDWDDCPDYSALFDHQDAFLYAFSLSPSVPAASIPTLMLYNPYLDPDGQPTLKAGKILVYQVTGDGLKEVTESFTASVTDDGDSVLVTKTRSPGVYILAEKAVELPGAASRAKAVVRLKIKD